MSRRRRDPEILDEEIRRLLVALARIVGTKRMLAEARDLLEGADSVSGSARCHRIRVAIRSNILRRIEDARLGE